MHTLSADMRREFYKQAWIASQVQSVMVKILVARNQYASHEQTPPEDSFADIPRCFTAHRTHKSHNCFPKRKLICKTVCNCMSIGSAALASHDVVYRVDSVVRAFVMQVGSNSVSSSIHSQMCRMFPQFFLHNGDTINSAAQCTVKFWGEIAPGHLDKGKRFWGVYDKAFAEQILLYWQGLQWHPNSHQGGQGQVTWLELALDFALAASCLPLSVNGERKHVAQLAISFAAISKKIAAAGNTLLPVPSTKQIRSLRVFNVAFAPGLCSRPCLRCPLRVAVVLLSCLDSSLVPKLKWWHQSLNFQ